MPERHRVQAAVSLAVLCSAHGVLAESAPDSLPPKPKVSATGAMAPTAPSDPSPRYGRAALEMATVLALGTAWYWAYRGDNANDWDDPDLSARVSGEAWRLDNNGLAMNFLAHPLSGSAFYALSRANHLNVPMASTYAFLTSFAWEYVVEFREKVSINDVIVTPGAGIAMGEFFNKLALYVNSSTKPPGTAVNVVRYTTGPTVALTRWLDGDEAFGAPPPDALGFSSHLYHDFRVHYAVFQSQPETDNPLYRHEVGYRGKFAAIDGYDQPQSGAQVLTDGNVTEFSINVSHSRAGSGLELFADTLLFGYHVQQANTAKAARATVGTSIAYHFLDSHAAGVPERRGVLHLPGIAAETRLTYEGVSLDLWARAHPDFAGVGSLAYPIWQEAFPDERPKAILLKQGYYYGLGATGRVRASLAWGPLALRSSFELSMYDSIEGLDRAKELVESDVEATDVFRTASAELVLHPVTWLDLRAGVTQRKNLSKAETAREVTNIVEHGLGATFAF